MARFIKYQTSGRAFLEPTKETMDGLEQAIRWAEYEVPSLLRRYMNELVFHMALYNQGEARKMSFGPYDPSNKDQSAAWKLPVRRITNAYYLGWKIRQVKPAVWQLYNDSREAFFIEFGINWLGHGRRVRRPVRKLSLRRTMDFMRSTGAFHRVWVDIYANPKSRHRGRGFYQIVQAPAGAYIVGWDNVSTQTAQNMLRNSSAGTMREAGLRLHGGRFQRAIYNRGGGGYGRGGATYGDGGPALGRRLPG